ncbi:MAG: CRISPR-associated endoribonuclease Cas6 [Candidatus Methanoperedens sp.]|nr:CRISPR-associated endoribonuclease Cas6 [Candidatus Methanoperedens sp.]
MVIPRVIVELESLKDCAYDLKYHNKLHGFVYKLLKATPYENIHDKNGYKHFCFSGIMPPFDMKAGDKRTLIISSPDAGLVATFGAALEKVKTANIGDFSFHVNKITLKPSIVGRSVKLAVRTPIVCKIPRWNYENYGIESEHEFVYWRKNLPFNAFLRQLEENLIKKYRDHKGMEIEEERYLPLFQQFFFKKQVVNHVVIEGKEVMVFGSLWEFIFSHLSREQQELLEFGVDSGLGEKNSFGFGFVDVVR